LHGLPPHLKKSNVVNNFLADSDTDSDDSPTVISPKVSSEGQGVMFTSKLFPQSQNLGLIKRLSRVLVGEMLFSVNLLLWKVTTLGL
jgi:hypothetical protein